jgi:hypothetical protein
VAGRCECRNEPSGSKKNVENFLTICGPPSFTRKTLIRGVRYIRMHRKKFEAKA